MYDPKAALLVVDVQNDFADPKGSLYVSGGDALVPFINAQIEKALQAGAVVAFSQDWHPSTTPHFQKDGGVWPVHCVAGTWGAELYPALTVPDAAETVRKGNSGEDGYSAFSVRDPRSGATLPTRLESVLRAGGIERVVILGLATDYCVKETALDARKLGFSVDVLTKGIAAVDLQSGDGKRALGAIETAGVRLL